MMKLGRIIQIFCMSLSQARSFSLRQDNYRSSDNRMKRRSTIRSILDQARRNLAQTKWSKFWGGLEFNLIQASKISLKQAKFHLSQQKKT